jgi:tellurite methyltransferase
VNLIFLLITSTAFSAPQPKIVEQNTYEAVTGESADEDKSFWDSFYKQKDNAFGKDAVGFLKENLDQIPKGKAFVPAMGEGRNAIYLAKHGFEVVGNDISEVAVDKTLGLAKKQNISIKAAVVDLKQYKFIENQFDFIFLSLYIDRTLIPGFKKSLKKGGYIMFYQELYDGDPKKATSLFWVKHNELSEILKDFKMITFKEYDDHGKRVAAALARKI